MTPKLLNASCKYLKCITTYPAGTGPRSGEQNANSQCLWSGGVSPKKGVAALRKPQTEQNPSFPGALCKQYIPGLGDTPDHIHTSMDRPRNHGGTVPFTMRYFHCSSAFYRAVQGADAAHNSTQFSFSKPALSCPGLFKLTFLAFTFIPLSVIKILITPLRPLETCSVSKALACIRRDHFPPEFQYWCICCQAEESQKHMHSFSWTLLQQKKAPEP